MSRSERQDPLGFARRSRTGEDYAEKDAAAYNALRALVASGDAIAFVGAGISVPAQFPTWRGLLSTLREEVIRYDSGFTAPVPPAAKDWITYADQLCERLGQFDPDIFADLLGLLFHRLAEVGQVPRYTYLRPFQRTLVRLPFAGWTTTNYDHVLEHAIADAFGPDEGPAPVPKTVCVYNGNSPDLSDAIRGITGSTDMAGGAQPRSAVIHWHGTYGNGTTVVLGARDYANAYGFTDMAPPAPGSSGLAPAPPIATRLFTVMAALLITRRIVFWGFSLEDPYVLHVLSRVARVLWEWRRMVHFAVLPLHVGDADDERRQRASAEERLGRLGIRAVWFPVVDNDYSVLEELIEKLAEDVAAAGAETEAPAVAANPVPQAVTEGPTQPTPRAQGQVVVGAPEWLNRAVRTFEEKGRGNAD